MVSHELLSAGDRDVARIELIQVTKKYGSTTAVSEVSLDIADGEFVVLLGPSGCGKSTILKMIAGLEEITQGEIYIADRLVNYVSPGDRDVAMVFQSYALYPHMTAYQNIAFPLRMARQKKSAIAQRVSEIAAILGLTAVLKQYPEELSGGQRQRVALGRAMARRPAAFLMDEPLSNLDAQMRVQMREELLTLHRLLHTTTVYVTHDQVEAMTMGHRIVVMNQGAVQQIGTPHDVYARPVNTFVARFIGTPGINLFAGEVRRDGGAAYFHNPDLRLPLPPPLAAALDAALQDGRVTLGVRPESVYIATDPDELPHRAIVARVEPVGSDLYVGLKLGATPCQVRTPPWLSLAEGQTVSVDFDAHRIVIFDSADRRIRHEELAALANGRA
jgi:multiple sugar transport system ATP-binding protein